MILKGGWALKFTGLTGLEYLSFLFQLLYTEPNISSYKLYIENNVININES